MAASHPDDPARLSPEEAFALLGDGTRLQILRALGEADGPLAFSEVFDRVDYRDSSNFGYHLDKLEDHFVRKTEAGYALQPTGRRVVEAVLSGVVTGAPPVERTPVESPCMLCGESLEVQYRHQRVELYCPSCGGMRSGASPTAPWASETADDIVGHVDLPPAGTRGRTPASVYRAAEIWTVVETQALARGVCPRCAARVDHDVWVCESHDAGEGGCERCGQQFAVAIQVDCTNCILAQTSVFTKHLLAHPDLMAFMAAHGIDPIAPDGFHLDVRAETVDSVDPFEGRFTFAADGDAITLAVEQTGAGDLSVVDATRHDATEPGR